MIVNIVADSPRGAFEHHVRMFDPKIEFDSEKKIMILTAHPTSTPEVFLAVHLHSIEGNKIVLKGLQASASGGLYAPDQRIIEMTQ